MSSIVLIGPENMCSKYIENFIKSEGVKSYNCVSFEESFKIQNSRDLKRQVSQKFSANEKRLFIIKSQITMDAQNALLKTIEELPASIHIVFFASTKESLLPTVLSRSNIVSLLDSSTTPEKESNSLDKILEKELTLPGALQLSEQCNVFIESRPVDDLIRQLRHVLLNSDSQIKTKNTATFLSQLLDHSPQIQKNNISKKTTLDSIALKLLQK